MVGLKQRSCILSAFVVFAILASSEGFFMASFWKNFCLRNPTALPGLCKKYLPGQSCPVTSWGEWQLQSFSSASGVSCPTNGKMLRFTRTKNVSHLSATCKSKAGKISQTEDRCKSQW